MRPASFLLPLLLSVAACSGSSSSGGMPDGTPSDPATNPDRDGDGKPDDPVTTKEPVITVRAPAELVMGRGAAAKVKVEVTRDGATAPATLRITNLPAGFTSAPISLEPSANSAVLEIAASEAASAVPFSAKIVASSGSLSAETTMKVTAPKGAFDPSFASAGKATIPFAASDLVALEDGRTLVIGSTKGDYWGTWALRMLAPDGTPDASFGSGGQLVAKTPAGWANASGAALAAKGDGTFYAVLNASFGGGGADKAVVVHVLADGKLDSSFGNAGYAFLTFDGWTTPGARSIAIEPTGKIVVAGGATNSSSSFADNPRAAVLARLTPNGQLDATFGAGGRISTSWNGTFASANGVKVIGGKTYAYGRGDYVGGVFRGVVVRMNDDGGLDSTFGTSGVVTTMLSVDEMALTPAGKILVRSTMQYDGVIQQLSANGSPDTSFGNDGLILDTSPLPGIGYTREPFPFAFGSTGTIFTMLGSLYADTVEVWAFDSSGHRITTFAGGGKLSLAAADDPLPRVLRATADGRFVGLATTSSDGLGGSVVMRFFP